MDLVIDIDRIKGFMPKPEGAALYQAALAISHKGPVVEIGTYCGKSAVYLGTACKATDSTVFAVDHHRGSEENQPGWEHYDPETWDARAGAMDTLPFLRQTLRDAALEDVVIPVVGQSEIVARYWLHPVSMLFIDGGHGEAPALTDYRCWSPKVMRGGYLAIHDVFPNPEDGGRPPFEIYCLALASGQYREIGCEGSLRILERL